MSLPTEAFCFVLISNLIKLVRCIQGGTIAHPGEYREAVVILLLGKPICVGVAVSENFVLTACQCIGRFVPGDDKDGPLKMHLKSHDMADIYINGGSTWIYEFYGGTVRRAVRSFCHPDFTLDPVSYLPLADFDLGVYELQEGFTFTETFSPLDLSSFDREPLYEKFKANFGKSNCQFVSWGSLIAGDQTNYSDVLIVGDVSLRTETYCDSFSPSKTTSFSSVGKICGTMREAQSVCFNDAGAPLYCLNQMYALLSFPGNSCGVNSTGHYDSSDLYLFSRFDYAIDFVHSLSNGGEAVRWDLALFVTWTCRSFT